MRGPVLTFLRNYFLFPRVTALAMPACLRLAELIILALVSGGDDIVIRGLSANPTPGTTFGPL